MVVSTSSSTQNEMKQNVSKVASYSPTGTDGSRKDNSSSIHCLPDILEVAPPRDLLDQHRRQALRSKFFVSAEEVDFGGGEGAIEVGGINSESVMQSGMPKTLTCCALGLRL